jgi:hypothetical protein
LYYSNDTNKKYNLQVKIYIFFNFFGFSLTYILIFGTIGASIFDLKGDYFEYFSNRNRNKEIDTIVYKESLGNSCFQGFLAVISYTDKVVGDDAFLWRYP